MKRKIKQNKAGLVMSLIVVILGVILGAYYLYSNDYFGTYGSYAAVTENTYKVDMARYHLELKPIDRIQPTSPNVKVIARVRWEYTVMGVSNVCYKLKTTVSDSASDLGGDESTSTGFEKIKFIITRLDYDETACTGAQDTVQPNGRLSVVSKGVFETFENQTFRYIVVYYSKKVPHVAPINISLNDVKFSTTNLKDFTVSGTTSNCYAASTFAVKSQSNPEFFSGTYGLRLNKVFDTNQNCNDELNKYNVKGVVNTKFLKGTQARFTIRYVYNGILNSEIPVVTKITKDGVTLRYAGDDNGNFTYNLTGSLPGTCYSITSSEMILYSGKRVMIEAKKVKSGTCKEVQIPFHISGSFVAKNDAKVYLVVTDLTAKPD